MSGNRRLLVGMTGVAFTAALVFASATPAWAPGAPPQPYRNKRIPPPPPKTASQLAAEAASSSAAAGGSSASSGPKRSKVPTAAAGYTMDFTLPTLGKAGCMVCHGDRNLIRVQGDQYVSYYIDEQVMRESAHNKIICTGCHVDFAYKAPHKGTASDEWRRVARTACKTCHQGSYDAFSLGVHAVSSKPGAIDPNADKKPLCGDCHGAHDIKTLKDDPQAVAELKADGYRICGRCHKDYWDSYADYYHGAAYRRGAIDAPACWDCHDAHTVLPSKDRRSATSPDRLVETCSKCHDGANEEYVSYAGLVHRKSEALADNPVYSWMLRTQQGISAALSNILGTVRSWFT